jgi:hypothetical protein
MAILYSAISLLLCAIKDLHNSSKKGLQPNGYVLEQLLLL